MTPAAKKPSSSPAVRLARAIVTAALVTLFTLAGVATASASPVQPTSGAVQPLARCTEPPANRNWECAGVNGSVRCAVRMFSVHDRSDYAVTNIRWDGTLSLTNRLHTGSSTQHTISGPNGVIFSEEVGPNNTESWNWNPPSKGTYLWIEVRDNDDGAGATVASQRCRVA